MTLKSIPKPEGFDLRNRRSEKSGRGSDWLPADALYDAQQEILKTSAEAGSEIDAVMVIYHTVDKEGIPYTGFRSAGDPMIVPAMFLNALGKYMGWAESK